MSANDSFVLVGGRRTLPKVHVEKEDKSSSLRYRREYSQSSTPEHTQLGAHTPNYGTPSTYSFTTFPSRGNKTKPSPTLQDLKEGRVEIVDSGYSGWVESAPAKKKLSFDSEQKVNVTNLEEMSIWEAVQSPVLDMKKKLQGRPSFLDDEKKSKIQPQTILAGIIMMIMISSVGFALLIGLHHLSSDRTELNGKLKSVKFGTEKKLESRKSEGRILDRDMLDENGEVLGGKRAAIQYAYESKVEEVGADKPILAKLEIQEAEAILQENIQEENQMDLLELAERIDVLSKILTTRINTKAQAKADQEQVEDIEAIKQSKARAAENVKDRMARKKALNDEPLAKMGSEETVVETAKSAEGEMVITQGPKVKSTSAGGGKEDTVGKKPTANAKDADVTNRKSAAGVKEVALTDRKPAENDREASTTSKKLSAKDREAAALGNTPISSNLKDAEAENDEIGDTDDLNEGADGEQEDTDEKLNDGANSKDDLGSSKKGSDDDATTKPEADNKSQQGIRGTRKIRKRQDGAKSEDKNFRFSN